MEKQTVQKLLDAKSPRLRFEPYEGGKSKVWASFAFDKMILFAHTK